MFAIIFGIVLLVAAIVLPIIMSHAEIRGGGIASAACVVLALVKVILLLSDAMRCAPTKIVSEPS